MEPTDEQTCWGEILQTVYVDDEETTFQSILPFTFYLYAEANSATNDLNNFELYMIAQGLHATSPICNDDTCRGYAHRQLWINMSALPQTYYDVNSYHWDYSSPSTINEQSSVSTTVGDTFTIGKSADLDPKNGLIDFQSSYSWSNSYTDSVNVQDVTVNEDTNPITGVGKWYYYQQSPFDISQYPPQDFSEDWQVWYVSDSSSNSVGGCVIQYGPNLAFNSQQTSTAIRWEASPELVNYTNASLNVVYLSNVYAEVDMVWCPDDPSNPNPGHHEIEWWILSSSPSWSTNVIQAMNNLNVTN